MRYIRCIEYYILGDSYFVFSVCIFYFDVYVVCEMFICMYFSFRYFLILLFYVNIDCGNIVILKF